MSRLTIIPSVLKYIAFFFFLLVGFSLKGQSQVDSLVNEGTKYHDEKNYEKAIEKYQEALKINPDSWLAHYEIAFSSYEMKDYENAILNAEKSIKNDKNSAYYSYVILGSAYDIIGKPKKAIRAYEKGIKKFPKKYLLYYNLALTYYNLNDIINAEPNAIKAIEFNPSHPSSHLLLAYMNNQKGERSKTVLSLYYFLMLEANSPRSKEALNLLNSLHKKGVTRRDEKNIDVVVNVNDDKDFGASELMMSLLEASKNLEENKDKSQGELFFENTKSFFTILGELNDKKPKSSFQKRFYVPFFKKLVHDKHTEAFSYYIQMSSEDKEVLTWLELNGNQIEKFGNWYENQNK
ncbi:tetratricopeptide repeat protein [Maribacter algarum]|uniref:Tetratricopeptide repeat protein n=1 Tax=Maribacter algarum (ex Zhang et al. 2020) TaxID=2578118 RepID=A0A5S3PTB9_9FLAO|nr:tetratricopeptide repeat protein [Maribacter algarum]TMM58148.1 tetratricopeptide repeat protein [Maribacter algarum]